MISLRSTGTPENNRLIIDALRPTNTPAYMDRNGDDEQQLSVNTLHGAKWVKPGDLVIRNAHGDCVAVGT